jgi:hypothetical protein
MEKHFSETYKQNTWNSNESKSGPGSERNSILVKTACETVVKVINTFLKDKEIIKISDIPCGDFNWIDILFEKIFLETNCKHIEYYAYDIVPEIENEFNNIKRKENVSYNFKVFNATKDVAVNSDIILCKEMFIHLSFEDTKLCIEKFKKSNSSYLICSDSKNIPNKDIYYSRLGECRDVSLLLPPFNLGDSLLLDTKNYLVFDINLL